MYKVKIDGNTIYNPASSDLVIIDPKLTLEVNNAGEFDFVMPPTHPFYGSVERLSSVVTVEEDGAVIFEGRPTEEKKDFWKRKTYHCEGALAYLKDTKQPPGEYHNITVRQYLGALLNVHNEKVGEDKRFELGAVTVTDSNDSLYRYTNWESTLQCINDDLLKSLGGYLRIRYEGGKRYLDYLAAFPNTNSQIIRFGRNLLDYASSYDSSDYCTVLIPQGAELEESPIPALHQRLSIEDVNGGSPYLVNADAVAEHGWIEKVIEWDGVHVATTLLRKGKKYLEDVQFDSMVLSIKAIDLHKLNPEIESIKLMDEIRAISKPHGMDRIFPVTKVSIPLDSASGTEYTLGTKVTHSLTSTTEAANEDILNRIKRAKTPQQILESAQDNASELIKSALNGYVVITDDASELLVMDTPDINTARKVWRWNVNGLGYSNNGYDGQYGLALTMDGAIVADFITAGTLNANLLKAGRIQDAQGYNYWDLQTGDFHLLALQDYAQKANVIIDTTPQYAVSTSSTTAPTTGWSTETPEWEEGKYVWFRLQMVNGNNQATYSAAVCIQGAKGEAGTSVTILGSYATLAELQAAHPTGALGDAYMAGNYLYVWNGSAWEDVGQIRGDDGRDATQYYTYFAYATSSDGSQGFSTQPFAGAAYMGVCTVTSPTQPQTYSTYKWSQARGDKGVGVTSQVPQYYLSESSVTQTGGMWSEDEPQWQSGYYIWSRLKIEWSSGETTYTSPVLAKALNGANQKAASAESTAEYAESTAASAETTANSAYNTATSAQTAADNAQSTADSATTKADAAQSTANTASTKADTAQSTAEGAQEAAETAQSTANTAQSTANNASTKADNAKAAADAAQETADGAREAVNTLDESLYTEEIFNRLTNNGAVQGIVMENGNLYVNASYINSGILNADLIKAGTISDAKGNNYWNLNTGEFSLSALSSYATKTEVQTAQETAEAAQTTAEAAQTTANSASTTATTAKNTADSAKTTATTAKNTADSAKTTATTAKNTADSAKTTATTAKNTADSAKTTATTAKNTADSAKTTATTAKNTADDAVAAVEELDESLKTEEIFNRLTDNGKIKGITMSNGNLYVNASYINTGTLNADLIKSGTINADLIKSGTINADLIKSGTINADLIKSGTINANLIKSGTIDADLIRAGKITDSKGYNYWDLDTGEFSLAALSNYATNSRVDAVEAVAQEAEIDAETAKSVADALDKSLDSEEVFKRLTNNGKVKGITMSDGNLYINASYINSGVLNADLMTAGIITDKKKINYWDLETGEFKLSALSSYATKTEVQTAQETAEAAQDTAEVAQSTADTAQTTAEAAQTAAGTAQTTAETAQTAADSANTAAANAQSTADTAKTTATTAKTTADSAKTTATSAKSTADAAKATADGAVAAVDELDEALKTEEIFNRLTDNGKIKGITMSNGNLYVNATYIKSGYLSANRIQGGTLKLGGSNNTYGKISIYDASGTLKGTINSGGISAQLGQFNAINIDNIDGDNSASITLNSERLGIEAGTLPVWVHNLHTNQLDVTTLGATNAYITYDNVTNLYANYVELTGDFVWWTSTAKANYVFAREARSSSPTGYTLLIPDAQIARLSFQPWNPANASTYYRPVASYGTNGNRVNYISAHSSSHSVPNSLGVNAQFGSTSAYSTKNFAPSSSDIRLKENVKDCEIEALPFIQKIRMRQFDWKENGVHQDCGFVADELEQLDENLSIGGGYNEDGTMNEKSVNDFYLVGYMVKAMQEMQAEIDYLKGVVKDGINRRVDTED